MTADTVREALRCDRPRCLCRRGRVVHCPAHADRSPSFSVDQAGERLLVFCHGGCAQQTVIAALQARQLWPGRGARPSARFALLSPFAQARREILLEARRQLGRTRELYLDADSIRFAHQVVREARRVATALGESDDAWELLAGAAWLETTTWAAEAAA